MSSKKKRRKEKFTSIDLHKREKSRLKPPLSTLNIAPIDWIRDQLPEFLWIYHLWFEYMNLDRIKIYHDFLDKLDATVNDEKIFLLGFLSDFAKIPPAARAQFLTEHKEFIYFSFFKPVGAILTFYPDNPASWLLLEEWKSGEKIDFETVLNKLSRSVMALHKYKELDVGHIVTFPLSRLVKKGKMIFFKGHPLVDPLSRYPSRCTDDEKYFVQSSARAAMMSQYGIEETYNARSWPRYFWRQNYNLAPCLPTEYAPTNAQKLSDEEAKTISESIAVNCEIVISYLDKLAKQYKYDLFDTKRDDILLGLFSRITRLYVVLASQPRLWARDLSGIFLRCIVDTAITFAYLAKFGTDEEFDEFKKYGEGKEKLLMLHLQDKFETEASLEGKDVAGIAEELGGGINPELIDIELSWWTKKDARRLAKDSGFEDLYKLVFDPASSDIHGNWTSIRKTNLIYCKQPLHRFHKIPAFVDPPMYLQAILVAQKIYLRCLKIGEKNLKFPVLDRELKHISDDMKIPTEES